MADSSGVGVSPEPAKKSKLWLLVLIALMVLGAGGYFAYAKYFAKTAGSKTDTATESVADENGEAMQKITLNKFGFLSGGESENPFVGEVGAAWVRPHPGPFLWDAMQTGTGGEIDFTETDALVKAQQKQNYGTLATLWPFADWDQEISVYASDCQVSANDEFLPKSKESLKKGRQDYLPKYRCKPVDFNQYEYWVKTVVERYDGDSVDDMPGLTLPIKYWEVMNEPDLTSPEAEPRLDFWKGNAADYAELLIKTGAAIREADNTALVVIAGAAGGDENFLNFYREVFKNKETLLAFDIANIHCISSGKVDSFNVEPYKKMLAEFGLNQPIWVTEAEAIVSTDPDINATATKQAVAKALLLGAERIFFTRSEFTSNNINRPPIGYALPTAEIKGKDAEAAYKIITAQ